MKRQTRRVGVAGGFFNQLMGNNSTEPVVGKGCTILMYSDRDPYQVIDVSEDGNKCTIQAMNYKFVGSYLNIYSNSFKSVRIVIFGWSVKWVIG